jgi:hypothetical protein
VADTRETTGSEWEHRIGAVAADHRTRWYRWLARASLAAGFFFALVIIGRVTHKPDVVLVAVVPGAAWGVSMALAFTELRKMRSEICTALGFPQGTRDCEPPRNPEAYLRWCEKKGLEPWPFREGAGVAEPDGGTSGGGSDGAGREPGAAGSTDPAAEDPAGDPGTPT